VRRLAVAVVVAVLLPSCGFSGLNFVQDDRVSIVTPDDRETVSVPFTVRWTTEAFDGTYAVFVDREPLRAGTTLASLASSDDVCEATPGCPDEPWFTERNVYATDATSLTIEHVPELNRNDQRAFHEVTIVLIGRDGKRVGESAFSVELEVDDD
jgi:hypothetical protein